MTVQKITDELFFNTLDKDLTKKTVQDALIGCHDGELFLEHRFSERLTLDDGRIKTSAFDATTGFGLRAVCDDTYAYAISNELTHDALKKAVESVQPIKNSASNATLYLPALTSSVPLYTQDNPLSLLSFENKVALMEKIDAYLRAKDPKVVQVSASLSGEWQVVKIIQAKGRETQDIRPLVNLMISVVVKDGDRMESGAFGFGGRYLYSRIIEEKAWKYAADEALRTALVNLESVSAPAGEMPVVLSSGWCGVLLHEAVGHGLEGDFNRKGSSVFTGKIGEVSIEDWDLCYAVNLKAPVMLTSFFLGMMRERDSGCIVFVSSSGAAPYLAAYETFKTAQTEFSSALSMELEGTHVYTYTIAPGLVKTENAAKSIEAVAKAKTLTNDNI